MSASDIIMLVLLPVLVICLIAGWLVYASRGRRNVTLDLKGFGISLSIASSEKSVVTTERENQ